MVLVSLLAVAVRAEKERKDLVYFEMGGNAGVYSLNYDRIAFVLNEKHRLGFRVGFSWLPVQVLDYVNVCTFPLMANYIYGGPQHRLELGMGVTMRLTTTEQQLTMRPSFSQAIVYRFQPLDDLFVIRFGLTPLWFDHFMPWAGFSLGRAL